MKQAYVPPHLRNKQGEALRPTMKLHELEEAKAITPSHSISKPSNLPPGTPRDSPLRGGLIRAGAAVQDQSLSKSQKKRLKEKEKVRLGEGGAR